MENNNICEKSNKEAWGYSLFIFLIVIFVVAIIYLKAQGYELVVEEIKSGIPVLKI